MSAGRKIGFAFAGFLLGGAAGAGAGLLGGLAWTEFAGTSWFEGQSGFVIAGWMLFGLFAGIIAGVVFALRRTSR